MQIDSKILKTDEKVAYSLRELYNRFGYSRYKMSKFEEYALYVKNKDFLVSDGIISFTDTNGRLLALKPDVTLSIINNSKDIPGKTEKLYYDENVYRISGSTHSFKEIKQTGLECIGDVGFFEICEVVLLAVKSLEKISENFIFEISHVGFLESVLKELIKKPDDVSKIISFISKKSDDELKLYIKNQGLDDEIFEKLSVFTKTYPDFKTAEKALEALEVGAEAKEKLNEFKNVLSFISDLKLEDRVRVDFSLTNTMNYYSGIAFKGYVEGVPTSVLSGGQYNKLMQKMGRSSGAIGFAVYLDTLERLNLNKNEFDTDVLLVHGSDVVSAYKKAEELVNKGLSVKVSAQKDENITYKQILTLNERGEWE